MPYRIVLKRARRVLCGKRRDKAHGVILTSADNTHRVEVRNGKGLLLFYRPHLASVKI